MIPYPRAQTLEFRNVETKTHLVAGGFTMIDIWNNSPISPRRSRAAQQNLPALGHQLLHAQVQREHEDQPVWPDAADECSEAGLVFHLIGELERARLIVRRRFDQDAGVPRLDDFQLRAIVK